MARALLDATLPPAPRHVQPAGAAPTPTAAVGGQSPDPASAPTRTQTQTQDMTGVAAGLDRSEPTPPRAVRVALPAAPPAPARVLALASRLPSASLFAHREPALVGRDEALRRLWSALLDAPEGPVVVALEAAPGLGSSGLLRAMGGRLREGATPRFSGSPTARPQTCRLPVWLLRGRGWGRLRPRPELGPTGPRGPRSRPGAGAAGRPDGGAGTRAAEALGRPGAGLSAPRPGGDRLGLPAGVGRAGPGRFRPAGGPRRGMAALAGGGADRADVVGAASAEARVSTEELVETADALGRQEANEAAWYLRRRPCAARGFHATDGVEARAARLAVALSDRMPQAILPAALPPIPLPPRSDPAWWDAVAAQGVRARRRYDLDAARG